MINKKKLQTGLKIIAFIFPFIFIGPSLFYMSGLENTDSKNLFFFISGSIIMLIALFGLFIALKKILDAIFEKKSNE